MAVAESLVPAAEAAAALALMVAGFEPESVALFFFFFFFELASEAAEEEDPLGDFFDFFDFFSTVSAPSSSSLPLPLPFLLFFFLLPLFEAAEDLPSEAAAAAPPDGATVLQAFCMSVLSAAAYFAKGLRS